MTQLHPGILIGLILKGRSSPQKMHVVCFYGISVSISMIVRRPNLGDRGQNSDYLMDRGGMQLNLLKIDPPSPDLSGVCKCKKIKLCTQE
jgi:hypothetical protein